MTDRIAGASQTPPILMRAEGKEIIIGRRIVDNNEPD